jgi:hypothetical protein
MLGAPNQWRRVRVKSVMRVSVGAVRRSADDTPPAYETCAPAAGVA